VKKKGHDKGTNPLAQVRGGRLREKNNPTKEEKKKKLLSAKRANLGTRKET